MPDNSQFTIRAAITGYQIRKKADGSETYVLEGMASNTSIDLTGERMADSALAAMAKSLESNTVYVNNEHHDDWDADFGEVTRLWVNDNHELMMEAELDPDHYRTKTLIKALNKGKKLGLSIGGIVRDWAMEWVDELGTSIVTYKDIRLFHVAITGTPAVADTWVSPITKSVKKGTPMRTQTQVAKTDEQAEAVAAEAEVVEQAAPAAEATVAEAATEAETPAEETQAEASESETTEESDAEEESEAAETPESATDADEQDAAGEEADETQPDGEAAPEAAPDQAESEEAEVSKSAVLGTWTEADLTAGVVSDLAWTLQDYIWSTMLNQKTTAAEKLSAIEGALNEFHTLVIQVAKPLAENADANAVKSAAEALQASRPEAVSKSINDLDAQVRALTRALADKETQLEAAQGELADKEGELETVTQALEEAQAHEALAKGRKAYVVGKFGEFVPEEEANKAATTKSVLDYWQESVYGTKERTA